MSALVVGGVECLLEETQVTLGHVVVPLEDIFVYGVANGPGELVVVYERRREERGYREARGAVRSRSTTTLALHGEHDLLIAWLRQRVPDRWRGYQETVAHVVDGPPPRAPERPVSGRLIAGIAGVIVLIVVGVLVANWYATRPPPPDPFPPGYEL